MALGAGYKSRCGIGLEGADAWGTLVAPTELIPFISADPKMVPERAEGESLIGKAGYEDIEDVIRWATSGAIEMYADYQALDVLWGLALGGTWTKTGASEPYTHTCLLGEDINRSISIAIDKDVEDFYVHGVKINTLTFRSAVENVTVGIDCLGQKTTRGTTHHAALVALAFTLGKRLAHNQAVFRIADCTDALAAGDAVDISDFTLTINNNLKADAYTTTGGKYATEPYRNAKRNVTIAFTLPLFTANTFFAARDAETKLQADITFTGAACGGGNYSLKLEFPTLKVTACSADPGDPGQFPNTVECKCYRNNGNTPMSAVTEESRLTLINARATAAWS